MDINTSLVSWINEMKKQISFGTITVSLVIHDGRVTRIDKSLTEKCAEIVNKQK